MAYKFQLGTAKLSGSIEQTDGDTTLLGLDMSEANVQNVGDISIDSISADDNDLAISLTDNRAAALEIRESSNVYMAFDSQNGAEKIDVKQNVLADTSKEIRFRAADQAIFSSAANTLDLKASASMGFAINGTSSLNLSAQGIELAADVNLSGSKKLAYGENMESGKILVSNGTEFASVAISGDASLASNGALTIANDSVEGTMLNTNAADGSTLELSSDSLSVLKVPNALTAGDGITAAGTFDGAAARTLSITPAQTTITSIYNTSLKLGRSASDDNIDFGTDDSIIFNIDNAEKFRIASGSVTAAVNMTAEGNLVVEGNLTVQGTTTTVESTTILVTGSISFEGSTGDDFETTLGVIDPTADRSINLANVGGTLIPFAAASTTAISATPAELNLLDAGAGSSVGLEAGDSVIIFDNSDSDNAKKVLMSDIKSFAAGGALNVVSKADGNNLEADKVNYFGDLNADATVTLPASAGLSAGQSVYIKAGNLTSGAKITINTQASAQKIDGADSIIFESPYAAVRLIYVAANDFRVF